MALKSDHPRGTCPVCKGTTRRPVAEYERKYITPDHCVLAGYDRATDTFPCRNCGGQYMMMPPTGTVPLRPDGTPCTHEYTERTVSNCYHQYTCKHCGDVHYIDSGD